jgi:hypothetical protein
VELGRIIIVGERHREMLGSFCVTFFAMRGFEIAIVFLLGLKKREVVG